MNSARWQDTMLIYRNLLFLCTSNEISERESKKPSHFISHQKKNKILRNKLSQGGERSILWKLENNDKEK